MSSTLFGPVKGSHPSLAQWISERADKGPVARSAGDHWFTVATEGRVVENRHPALAIPRTPEKYSEFAVYTLPETYVAHLNWGRLATGQFEVIGPDDCVFDDLFLTQPGECNPAQSLILPWLARPRSKSGTYVTICAGNSSNYYHWVNDCLTRLWVLERGGFTGRYSLIVPEKLTGFQKGTLELLGYPAEKLVPFGRGHWQVEHLVVPSFANPLLRSSPEACQWLKERLLSRVEGYHPSPSPSRIYVGRGLATKRRLLNEDRVVELLAKHGFVCVYPEIMTVREQVRLFHQAEVVVAPHGAGLTNVIFMRAGTLLIEFVPHRKTKPCYYALASAVNVNYACITDAPDVPQELAVGRQPDLDFTIPLERLSEAVRWFGL